MNEDDLILRNSDFGDFGDRLGYICFAINCITDASSADEAGMGVGAALSNAERYIKLFAHFKDT